MNNKKSGFTLVELIVVVGIIGLLSALAVVSLSRQQARSRDSRRVGDITNINTALQSYIAEKLEPPVSASDYDNWDMSSSPTTGSGATDFISGISSSGYMTRVPVDPINNATADYWWQNTLNGFSYGYKWEASDNVVNGYYSYFLGANVELAGNPATINEDYYATGRHLVLKTVPVRPAN